MVSVPVNIQGVIAMAAPARDGRPATDNAPDPVRDCSGSARAPMSYVPNTAHDIFDGVARAWAVVPCAAPASAPETGAIPTTTSLDYS